MNGAKFQVDYEVLKSLLCLPEDAKIYWVNDTKSPDERFWVFVEHPDLPEIVSGYSWKEMTPIFETNTETNQFKMIDWGVEEESIE